MALSAAQPPIVPRPLHNEDATIRIMARQMLADLDENAVSTAVPTPTLKLILMRLCDALADTTRVAAAAAVPGMLLEASSNPNLRHWQARRDADEAAAVDADC